MNIRARFRPWYVVGFALNLAALLVLAGCGSDGGGTESGCTPGATQSCVCPGGEQGAQVCRSDGSGWKACNCGGIDAGSDAGEMGSDAGETDAASGCDAPNACGGCSSLEQTVGESCSSGGEEGVWACEGTNVVSCRTDGVNPCGGMETLDSSPGEACGTCLEGTVACDGQNATTCMDAESGTNACGGCASLEGTPGSTCGACDGSWACDGENRVVCDGGAKNACGGCEELQNTPGSSCGTDQYYQCDGDNRVTCGDNSTNACGGTASLDNQPGTSCGPCDEGTYICGAPNVVVCEGAGSKNACGGCGGLRGRPGTACGQGGSWKCDGQDAVTCTDEDTNACGGTMPLGGTPGMSCGTCGQGTWICDGTDAVACHGEVDTSSDPQNCGSCGNACDLEHAYASCSGGNCSLDVCEAGWGNCDGNASNGCETELNTTSHCGTCGNACQFDHGTAACQSGSCVTTSCDSGWADCDADPTNGCETSLTTTSDCGMCGNTCQLSNATAACNSQTCQVASCSSGYGNCDSMAGNGCEQQLNTLSHCGACGNACNLPNATATCNSGTCEVSSCDSGYADCNGFPADGCEISTTSSLLNCGSCNNACSAGQMCQGGSCVQGYAVAASTGHSCTTRTGSTVQCWGENGNGQLGRGTTGGPEGNPNDVSSSDQYVDVEANIRSRSQADLAHSCAIDGSGGVDCWGYGSDGQLGHGLDANSDVPVAVSGLSGAVDLGLGERHTCAVLSNGDAKCWGANGSGQLGDGSTTDSNTPVDVSGISDAVSVAASSYNGSCLVVKTGEVYCWGSAYNSNTPTQKTSLKSMRVIDGGIAVRFCGITDNRDVQCWQYDGSPTSIGLSNAVRVDVGTYHACAVRADGEVFCWALSTNAENLGDGNPTPSRHTPVQVKNVDSAVDVSVGNSHTCAVTSSGKVHCWGDGGRFKLGLEQNDRPKGSAVPVGLPSYQPVDTEIARCTDGNDNDGDGSVDCSDADCAEDLGSQTGSAVGVGDLDQELNHHRGSCGGTSDGAEKVFYWKAPSSATYTFTANPQTQVSHCRPYVYLRQSCGGAELGCSTADPPSVSASLVAGETVAIVVDNDYAPNTDTCAFNLSIQ